MDTSGGCEITLLLRDGLALVSCSGDLDLLAIRDLERTLEDVAATAPRRIHVDLSRVPFLASSGIGVLVRRARAIRFTEIPLSILVSEPVRQTLDVVGAADLLPIRVANVATRLPQTTDEVRVVRSSRGAVAHRPTTVGGAGIPDLAAAP